MGYQDSGRAKEYTYGDGQDVCSECGVICCEDSSICLYCGAYVGLPN